MIQRPRLQTILLLAILLFAGVIRFATLNKPFMRDTEGCGAFYGLLSRNYFRYDFAATHGIPVISMGAGAPAIFYANHPPTTPLLIALVNKITGYHGQYDSLPGDWQVRLPTAIFTLACISMMYWILQSRGLPRAGVIAAAIFASIPMTLMFGGLADVISPHLDFFILLSVVAYERFHRNINWRNLLLLIAAFAGAAIIDWPAYFLLPILGIHFVCTRPIRQWNWIIVFALIGTILFAANYAYLTLGQSDWHWMVEQFQHRAMSSVGDSSQSFTFAQWFHHAVWEMAIGRHTLLIVLLAILWIVLLPVQKLSCPANRTTGLILAWGVLHVLIGRQGVYQHEWWWWPFTPGLVTAAALAIEHVLSIIERNTKLGVTTLNVITGIGLLIFAGWNIRAVILESSATDDSLMAYSLQELGQVVRDNTPPDDAAMIAESDQSLASWYYVDRAVKRNIWDLPTFQHRLHDGTIDLSFDTLRPSEAPVHVLIVPKPYLAKLVPPLLDYLNEHYPQKDAGKFIVFEIFQPKSK